MNIHVPTTYEIYRGWQSVQGSGLEIGTALLLGLGMAFMLGLLAFLLPIFIACQRGVHNAAVVAVVNCTLGMTGIGWVVALVMACVMETDARRHARLRRAEQATFLTVP
ncbi:superinfection immunity protein [Komagataeibacter medellinensis]|uniref:Superinfection immunity protein n=1 Tax=Komagataeibacter medellinensis TaxID=1177712 RepID=A0ABQ6VRL0_9PROT|nr:superinfection immunity protein [Komagataeibacter medellinensis]KAB8122582.1 superinfection immunity protein [Komagataeibacter medellinensis]